MYYKPWNLTIWELNTNVALVLVGIVLFLIIINNTSSGPDLSAIPAYGPSGRLTSYIGTFKFLKNTCGVLHDEVNKRKGEMFRVPFLDHWEVVITGKQFITELGQAPDDDLLVSGDIMQTEYTMGPPLFYDQYHVPIIKSTMTRNLVARFDDVYDEIVSACEDFIHGEGQRNSEGWISVPAWDAVAHITARVTNRLFVGLPLCRNLDYLRLSMDWAVSVFIGAFFINFIPGILKPLSQQLVSFRRRRYSHPGKVELKRIVTERVLLDREYGVDRPDRPNDAISWFYDGAVQRYPSEIIVDDIVDRIMFLNFSAIHTSTNSLTNILYHLAEHPEIYLQPLREEASEAIAQYGWTKTALLRMVKIDSFMRESERMNGLGSLLMTRKVVNPKGFTFSNGVHLPKGAVVSVANLATHRNEDHYMNANTFHGFRFSDIRDAGEGIDAIHHQFYHTGTEYVPFGFGRHSCPGRSDEPSSM
ncbi:hypothetical protein H0H87_004056 [Tephrocybe sp. NHM501043]|nr:hypothetical protein H0H87_004056 [Tephrocybe sp. NHM501043]